MNSPIWRGPLRKRWRANSDSATSLSADPRIASARPLARASLVGDAREPGKLRVTPGEPTGALRRREQAAVGQALGAPPGVLGGRATRCAQDAPGSAARGDAPGQGCTGGGLVLGRAAKRDAGVEHRRLLIRAKPEATPSADADGADGELDGVATE